MPNPTSQKLKEEIISLHLQGYPNSKVANTLNTSSGNVHNVIEKFKENLDSGEYEDIRTFVNSCKKTGKRLSEVLEAYSTHSMLQNNNVDKDNFEKFFKLYNLAQDCDPSELADYSFSLLTIASKTDMEIEQIPDYYESILEKSQKLESEIKSLQIQKNNLESEVKKALQKSDTTLETLESFNKIKEKLRLCGLDIDDTESLARMIFAAKSEGYNITEIIQYISKEQSFEKRLLTQKQEIDEQQEIINNFDKEISSKEKQHSDLKNKLDSIKETYKEEKNAIDTIKKLSSKGISVQDIVRWEHVRKKSKLQVPEFDKLMLDAHEHIGIIEELQIKADELTSEISKNKGVKNALLKEIVSKESEIKKIDERLLQNGKDAFNAITKIAQNAVTKFNQIQDYHSSTIRHKTDETIKKFENDLGSFTPKLDELLAKILSVVEDKSKLIFLETLYLVFTEAKGGKSKVFLSMVQLLTGLEKWVKNYTDNYILESDVRTLKNRFQEQLEKQNISN